MHIRIGISKTIATQAFENIKPCVEVEDSVEEGESYDECYDRLRTICSELFEKELDRSLGEEADRKKQEWVTKYNKTIGDKH